MDIFRSPKTHSPKTSPRSVSPEVANGEAPKSLSKKETGEAKADHAAMRIRPDTEGHTGRLPDRETPGNGRTSAPPREDRYGNPIGPRERESDRNPWAGLMETSSGDRTRTPVESLHAAPGFLSRQAVTTLPESQTFGRKILSAGSGVITAINAQAPVHLAGAVSLGAPVMLPLAALPPIIHGVSARNAHSRVQKLRELRNDIAENKYPYEDKQGHLATHVLPYVIHQQEKRQSRKTVAAIPIVGGMIELGRSMVTHFKKDSAGTLHVERNAASETLAHRIATRDSGLAHDIVSALFNEEKTHSLMGMPVEKSSEAIYNRLSTTD